MHDKIYNYLIVLIIALTVMFIVGCYLSGPNTNVSSSITDTESEGNKVFNAMNSVFEEDKNSESPVFSDFISNYAGGYIDGDHLTIYVKGGIDDPELFASKMREKGIESDSYDIFPVDYSYSDLESQMQSFWDFRNARLSEGLAWPDKVYSVAICQERNCITVSVDKDLKINDYPDLLEKLKSISYELDYMEHKPCVIEE